MTKTSGSVNNWQDPNPNEPYSDESLDKSKAKGCWRFEGVKGLTLKSKLEACEVRSEILDEVAIKGGVIAADIDRVNMEAISQEMNDFIRERRPWRGQVPDGHDEPRWKVEFQWLSITIFTMEVTWETIELLRMIVTHCAPCKMLDSNPDKSSSWEEMAEAAKCAMEQEFLRQLFKILRTANATIPSSDNIDLASIPVEDCYVALAGCRIFWQKLLHFNRKGAVCLTHNIMIGDQFNLFDREYSGLVRPNGEPAIFGSRMRSTVSAKKNKKSDVEKDYRKNQSITNAVSRDATENSTEHDLVRSIVKYCSESRLECTDKQYEPRKALVSYRDFSRKGGGLWTSSQIPDLALSIYENEGRENVGNPNARGSDVDTQKAVSLTLKRQVESASSSLDGVSGEFIVQCLGTAATKKSRAKKKKTKNGGGTVLDIPAHGTEMTDVDLADGATKAYTFSQGAYFEYITLGGLIGRFKPPKKRSNKEDGHYKIERHHETHRLQVRRGMVKFTGDSVSECNSTYFAFARVVDLKKAKEAGVDTSFRMY